MTTKEVKQWLWRARGIDKEILALQEIRDHEFERVTKISAQLTGMPATVSKDPHKFDRLAELNDQIEQLSEKLTVTKSEILAKIYRLEDSRYRTVLSYYYVDCMTIEQIAAKMHYSFSHVKRLRIEALNAIKMSLV